MNLNTLYYGDCLEWMRQWNDGSVDLIYLDPPFNSNATYNVLYSTDSAGAAQTRAFDDTWLWDEAAEDRLEQYLNAAGRRAQRAIVGLNTMLGKSGMLAYLTYMAERLEEMHRLLKPTGSIYLHCDPTASHGLKLLMDVIFEGKNFRNEVVWKRTGSHGGAKRWGPVHDVILFYTRSDRYTWNRQFQDFSSGYLEKYFRHRDKRGIYQLVSLTGAGIRKGDSGRSWRGVNPTDSGRHWAVPKTALENAYPNRTDLSDLPTQEKLDLLDRAGLVYWPQKGCIPRQKRYATESQGPLIQDVVVDIPPIGAHAKERLGYPTQKPIALLDRIIRDSSNEGDIVLDPFCGCGTAIEAARRLGRRWIGIDISSFAIDLIRERRLQDKTIPAEGIPYDLESARKLAAEKPFNFESWAVTRLRGFAPNVKQIGDGGLDGRATLAQLPEKFDSRLALAQVKGGKYTPSYVRDFVGVMHRDQAAIGCFITLEPITSRTGKQEALGMAKTRVSGYTYPRMQLWSIREYFDGNLPMMPIMNDPYTGKPQLRLDLFRQ